MSKPGYVNIRGKEYKTVAQRIQDFRLIHMDWSIVTEILEIGEESVLIKALVLDQDGRVIATGHALEERSASTINKTSMVENGETSAVGRALNHAGWGDGPSADEMMSAFRKEEIIQAHDDALERHQASVDAVKGFLAEGNFSAAKEAWHEIGREDQQRLWLAPSRGGCLTTQERAQMKSNEWSAA